MTTFHVRPVENRDREWITGFLTEQWGSVRMVAHGEVYFGDALPAFIALQDDKPVGLLTYRFDRDSCEIGSMNSLVEGIGIGSALVAAAKDAAKSANCRRLWLITTNDNMKALRFWQKRGFSLVAVYPKAVDESRKIKPEIPLVGNDGIPIRDEIELEMFL